MDQGISRRQFLRGDIGNRRSALPPPWFQTEQSFLAHCDQCGDCLTACKTGILERGAGGYPQVNFHNGECSFCAACVQACPTGALVQRPGAAPWSLHAFINTESCLASRGVLCLVCGEHCAAQAIHFPRAAFAIAAPILNRATCTGCGACVASCPAHAITIVTEAA
jgi:ferredoxin-type protein NapF